MRRVADDTRTRILDLAVAAIDAGGEASLRLDPILAAAGVTAPTLYHHFGSREGLVVAAQIERYTRQNKADIASLRRALSQIDSAEEFRVALRATWNVMLGRRAENRWRKINIVGSAYGRPELEAAVAEAQDEIVAAFVELFEPARRKGWIRTDVDLVTTVAWQIALQTGRVFLEHGQRQGDPAVWDALTFDALERTILEP